MSYRKPRVLLTGATGFIGRRVLTLLAGHEVLCLTRDAAALRGIPNVTALGGCLAEPEAYESGVKKFRPEWCLHLAWEGLPDYSIERSRINLSNGIRLFEVLSKCGIQRIVVAGTCWEYGSASGAVREEQVGSDLSVFAAAKHAQYAILDAMARTYGFEHRWARIFFSYGAGQRMASLLPAVHAAYTSGTSPEIRSPFVLHDFIHVDDVAEGLLAIAKADCGSGAFNIATGVPISVAELVNLVASHFGIIPPYPRSAAYTGFWADMSRTYQATGWRTKVPIEQGIQQVMATLDKRR